MYFINKKVRLVKFVDRTFNCNPKFAMAIWEFLIKQNTNTQFYFEIAADILNNEEILKESNIYLKEVVRFNYLIYYKKRGLPEFLISDIEREEEKSIKEKLKEEYSFKEYHLEKFKINFEKYVETGEIIEEDSYYLFNDKADFIDIQSIK